MILRNKKIAICMAGSFIVVFLISLLVWGGGSSSRKPPIPPPKPQPQQAQQQQQPAAPVTEPAKSSPIPSSELATPATAASPQELVKELRQINSQLGEINRRIPAEQAEATAKALGEITWILEQRRQTASTSAAPPAAAQPQSRREQLSDKELERRYKERLLSQEP